MMFSFLALAYPFQCFSSLARDLPLTVDSHETVLQQEDLCILLECCSRHPCHSREHLQGASSTFLEDTHDLQLSGIDTVWHDTQEIAQTLPFFLTEGGGVIDLCICTDFQCTFDCGASITPDGLTDFIKDVILEVNPIHLLLNNSSQLFFHCMVRSPVA